MTNDRNCRAGFVDASFQVARQKFGIDFHGAQRRTEIVRDHMRKCREFLVRPAQLAQEPFAFGLIRGAGRHILADRDETDDPLATVQPWRFGGQYHPFPAVFRGKVLLDEPGVPRLHDACVGSPVVGRGFRREHFLSRMT